MTVDRGRGYDRARMNARSFLALACVSWPLAVPSARAQGGPDPAGSAPERAALAPTDAELAEARHSFEVGMQAYDAGEYPAAATEFRAAYELTHAADLLFNVYLAEERAGRLLEAADALEGYLRDARMPEDQRALLARRLERLRARIASRTASVALPDATAEQRAEDLLSRELLRDSAEAIGPPAGPPRPPVDPGPSDPAASSPATSSPHLAGIGVLVGAGALALAFAVLAPLSELEDQRVAGTCGRDVGRFCDPGDTAALEAISIGADAAWIGATLLATIGVVLVIALPFEGSGDGHVALTPVIAPGTIGAAAEGSF